MFKEHIYTVSDPHGLSYSVEMHRRQIHKVSIWRLKEGFTEQVVIDRNRGMLFRSQTETLSSVKLPTRTQPLLPKEIEDVIAFVGTVFNLDDRAVRTFQRCSRLLPKTWATHIDATHVDGKGTQNGAGFYDRDEPANTIVRELYGLGERSTPFATVTPIRESA